MFASFKSNAYKLQGLEKHISTMYEELVEEFNNKKNLTESVSRKDQKIQWVLQDLAKTRQEVRDRDAYISQFKVRNWDVCICRNQL